MGQRIKYTVTIYTFTKTYKLGPFTDLTTAKSVMRQALCEITAGRASGEVWYNNGSKVIVAKAEKKTQPPRNYVIR